MYSSTNQLEPFNCKSSTKSTATKNREATYDVSVLDARLRQSLLTVRSLGRQGLRMAAMETINTVPIPTFSSRWCHHKTICPAQEGTKDYLTSLEQVLDLTAARVLITSSDGTIELIRQHRERLEAHVQIALAKEPALAIAVNKEQTLQVAKQLGVGIPRSVSVEGVSEVGAAVHEVGLPAVVKPVESWVQNEHRRVICQLVTTLEEAQRAVEVLTCFGGRVLFQQLLSGKRESLSFFCANGQVHARFAQWAKRTSPPLGGTNVVRQSIAIPEDIGKQAERLIREIELEGYSEVEFRRDSIGLPYLMEINPRLTAGIELAVHAGINFPYLLYQWANGDRIDVVKDYRTGIWMRYLSCDFATTLAAILQRGRPGVTPPIQAILDFCTSFFVPMKYDYLDWKDPLPILAAMIGFPCDLLRNREKRSMQKKEKEQ